MVCLPRPTWEGALTKRKGVSLGLTTKRGEVVQGDAPLAPTGVDPPDGIGVEPVTGGDVADEKGATEGSVPELVASRLRLLRKSAV